MLTSQVTIQTEDFDLSQEIITLRAQDLRVGAVCSCVGTVRDTRALTGPPADEVQAMELDFYAARIVHRVGRLLPADQIVLVAVTSAHRGESFKACEFLMDYLKTQAPFWKKEQTPQGAQWVDARVSDDAALARWGIAASNA